MRAMRFSRVRRYSRICSLDGLSGEPPMGEAPFLLNEGNAAYGDLPNLLKWVPRSLLRHRVFQKPGTMNMVFRSSQCFSGTAWRKPPIPPGSSSLNQSNEPLFNEKFFQLQRYIP